MSKFDTVDFFTHQSLIEDLYLYFEHLRSKGPGGSSLAGRSCIGTGVAQGKEEDALQA